MNYKHITQINIVLTALVKIVRVVELYKAYFSEVVFVLHDILWHYTVSHHF